MDTSGFGTLAWHVADRTVITYDPRGLGRSTRHDGRSEHTPGQNADDVHRIIEAIGGPMELFASSGGGVTGLAPVAAHPDDETTLVAHEPPLLAMLPDAEQAFAAERDVQAAYRAKGWGTAWPRSSRSPRGEGSSPRTTGPDRADPAAFGLPTDDDGSREDPLLSGVSNAIMATGRTSAALTVAPPGS